MTGPNRRVEIADAAIAVLAEEGARGLTHRAVDAHLALPAGSTSYYFRTRAALLVAATERLVAVDRTEVATLAPAGTDPAPGLADLIAWWSAPERRHRLRARYELFLEAGRNEEIRDLLREPREGFIRHIQAALATTGMPAGRTVAITINAVVEGLLLNEIAQITPVDPVKLRALLGALTGAPAAG